MSNLRNFFKQLSQWEGKPAIRLAAKWSHRDREAISVDIKQAFQSSGLASSALPMPSVTNQALGNRFADVFCARLAPRLRQYRIERCEGPGYPDRRLVRNRDGRAFVLELKTTRDFSPQDDNRIVLTSTSDKLRRCFPQPVRHLLATICYRRDGNRFSIRFVRLDYLKPSTPVQVRLEGSVSKRILSAQRDDCALIPGSDKELSPAPGTRRRKRKHN